MYEVKKNQFEYNSSDTAFYEEKISDDLKVIFVITKQKIQKVILTFIMDRTVQECLLEESGQVIFVSGDILAAIDKLEYEKNSSRKDFTKEMRYIDLPQYWRPISKLLMNTFTLNYQMDELNETDRYSLFYMNRFRYYTSSEAEVRSMIECITVTADYHQDVITRIFMSVNELEYLKEIMDALTLNPFINYDSDWFNNAVASGKMTRDELKLIYKLRRELALKEYQKEKDWKMMKNQ